jgi:hypothetical protein
MKKFPGLTKCVAFATAAFSLMAIAQCDRKHNVLFLPDDQNPNQIIIPGTEISKADADTLTGTLRESNADFYLIQPFENGVPGMPFGKLSDIFICKEIGVEVMGKGRPAGFTRWTRVVGQGCFSRCPNTRRGRLTRNASKDDSEELVKKVAPVLLKYSKNQH